LNNRIESEIKSVNAGECTHLRTDFSVYADLSGSDVDRLIRLLHPTPAVCGYPQKEAMDEILKRERHGRQFYSGFSGPVSATNQMELFVNLRCMKIGRERIELFVGGGITKESDPQKEWDETVLKARTVMKFLENNQENTA
jgi:isochorismate synthase